MFSIWRRRRDKPVAQETLVTDYDEEYSTLELIDREADRQLAAHAQTSGAIATRAALVVSTAIFFVSLSKDTGESSWAYITALVSAAIGVALGVGALFLNRSGEEVDLEGAEGALQGLSKAGALRSMIGSKLATLDQDRTWVEKRECLTRLGFLCLGVALASTMVHIIFIEPTAIESGEHSG